MGRPRSTDRNSYKSFSSGLKSALWSDGHGLLRNKWKLGQTHLTTQATNYARQERIAPATSATSLAPTRVASGEHPTVLYETPCSKSATRSSSSEESSCVGTPSSNASELAEWHFRLEVRPLPCTPLTWEEERALAPLDGTLRTLIDNQIQYCRKLCIQYGCELVHTLMEESGGPRAVSPLSFGSLFKFSPFEDEIELGRVETESGGVGGTLLPVDFNYPRYSSGLWLPDGSGDIGKVLASANSSPSGPHATHCTRDASQSPNVYATSGGPTTWASPQQVPGPSSAGAIGIDSAGWPVEPPECLPSVHELFGSMSAGLPSPPPPPFQFAGMQQLDGSHGVANVASMSALGLPTRPPTEIRYPAAPRTMTGPRNELRLGVGRAF